MGLIPNASLPSKMTTLIAGSRVRLITPQNVALKRQLAKIHNVGREAHIYNASSLFYHKNWKVKRYSNSPVWLKRGSRGMAGQADVKKDAPKDTEKSNKSEDPRIDDLGRAIEDDYAAIRENYGMSPSYHAYLSS
jgi:hypothetical protein